MSQAVTDEMVEAAMRETPFIPNENNRAWMVRAISAALETAKAAAQSDYEARIRSAFVPGAVPSFTPIQQAFREGFKAGSRGGQSIDAACETFSEPYTRGESETLTFKEAWEQIYPPGKSSEAVQRANKLLLSITGREGGSPRINWYLLRNRIADALSAPLPEIEGGDKGDVPVDWNNPDDPVVKYIVGFDVEDYVAEYEFTGDEGYYTPNEEERALITDAIHGLIPIIHEELRKLIPAAIEGETKP